jgi:amidase/6-aminohexanoate-cyclic-dimer hydrolase
MTLPFPDYEQYDAVGLAELVARRAVTPEDLLEAAIARVEQRNPRLNAVTHKLYDHARAQIAAGLPDGPFLGVPFVLKDQFLLLAGAPTTHGSRFFADAVADHDSTLVARQKRAGLVIFGKTNTPELGLMPTTEPVLFGPTRNPWQTDHSAGGSSGGAAATVAAGIVPAAHASDGGGSIRIPASCCGVFGLKPTRARNPLGPDLGENWNGMTHAHAVTRSVRDSAALLDATAGPETGDPYSAPPAAGPFRAELGRDPGRLRVALMMRPLTGTLVDPEVVAAVTATAKLLERLGHYVEEAAPPLDGAELGRVATTIIRAHTRVFLENAARARGRDLREDDVEPGTWGVYQSGAIPAEDYIRAVQAMHRAGRAVARFHDSYDILLTPVLARPPVPIGVLSGADRERATEAMRGYVPFTALANLTGQPAMSVPLHWTPEGLPIGSMLAAPFGAEATLFRLAGQLEQAQPWADRRPAL